MERSDGLKSENMNPGARFHSRGARYRRQQEKDTPQKWVQCTRCKKWRQVPYHLKDSDLGDRWACKQNIWDPMLASCKVPQVLSDEQIDARLKASHEDFIEPSEQGGNYQAADPQSMEFISNSAGYDYESRKQPSPFFTASQSGIRSAESYRRSHYGRISRRSPNSSPVKRDDKMQNGDLSEVAEALLKLQNESNENMMSVQKSPFAKSGSYEGQKFVPGDLVWGKVEGHEWWPAKVVRRRSVPSEVGPPPGGALQVMFYIPVVFFTPRGIPKEVELAMDSYQFPIALCQRANGFVEEDEAEYAWLSADNIRPFCNGDTNGKKDGLEVNDIQLQSSIQAAHKALMTPDPQLNYWNENEDSDGGWSCAAAFNKSRQQQKQKKASRRKPNKRVDEMPSDVDSGADGGPEMLVYENWMLTPKIAVEQIYAWRRPLTCEEKTRELEKKQEKNRINLQKLKFLTEKLDKNEPVSVSMFDSWEEATNKEDPQIISAVNDGELRQQEKEAVSALLGLSPLTPIDGEPVLSSIDEAEYFVKYANRSHVHNEWAAESTLMKFAKRKLTQFRKKFCNGPVDMFNEDWMKPERIISRRKSKTGPGWELLIKWTGVGTEDCTWETEGTMILTRPETALLYIELWKRQMSAVQRNSLTAQETALTVKESLRQNPKDIENPIPWLHNGQLYCHQVEALNWCQNCWLQSQGGVLLGQLGQGRTAALVALLKCLREEMKCVNPFLIVVPSNQITKWAGEIAFWSGGSLDTVVYTGPHTGKPFCLELELWQTMECLDGRYPKKDTKRIPKADLVLLSLEVFPMELELLMDVPWDVVLFDLRYMNRINMEKYINSRLQIQCPYFIAACELPSSENVQINMLNLVNPRNALSFESLTGNEDPNRREPILINELNEVLRANSFEVNNPPKVMAHQAYKEYCIPLSFKPEQQEQYKECVIRHYDLLKDDGTHRYSTQSVLSLKAIVEELCLVCQHPLLIEDEEDIEAMSLENSSQSSAKLEALSCFLETLKDFNLNVLLLTQTQQCFTLLYKYLNFYMGKEAFESMSMQDSATDQHKAIYNFSSNSNFVFLTTKDCCGLGMSLQKINCVIVFESSPKTDDDLIALGRAYQIGSCSELPVFRFFISGSVEERMMQLITKSESKGNSYDLKVLEDVLVWGTQGLFENSQIIQKHPYLLTTSSESMPMVTKLANSRALVQEVFNLSQEDNSAAFVDCDTPLIQGCLKTKESLSRKLDGNEIHETVRHMNDPLLIAGYWEQTLQSDWLNHQQKEEARIKLKREESQREGLDDMEYEMDRDLVSDGDLPDFGPDNDNYRKHTIPGRKRYALESECYKTLRGQKKQKSGQKMDSESLICVEEASMDHIKISKEELLSSKAHQDVLAQIIADPNTSQGKAAQEASLRIDAIAKDFSIPSNIVMMARHIVEILLTLKEDHDQGAYFQQYTLLAIICFASSLGGYHLGEKHGLKELAIKYSQDLGTMEQVFNYVAQAVYDYRKMLLRIRNISDQRLERVEDVTPAKKNSDLCPFMSGSMTLSKLDVQNHCLHRDLDLFLSSIQDIVRKEKEVDVEQLSSCLSQSPGEPIKGHVPNSWFPTAISSENQHLNKEARLCEAEQYIVEQSFENKRKQIEKVYHTLQERVREHGVKAIERITYDTEMMLKEIENKKKRLKQNLRQTTVPSSNVGNLFAAIQQSPNWTQHNQDHKQDSGKVINTLSNIPGSSLLNRKDDYNHHPVHDVGKHENSTLSNLGQTDHEALSGISEHIPRMHLKVNKSQGTSPFPLEPIFIGVNPVSSEKLQVKNHNKIFPQSVSRMIMHHNPSASQSSHLSKSPQPYHQGLMSSQEGYPRLPHEESGSLAVQQHNQRIQNVSAAQNQQLFSAPNVRVYQQHQQQQHLQNMSHHVPGSLPIVQAPVFSNHNNVCMVPHPTVPGITSFSTQQGPLEDPHSFQKAAPVLKTQNPRSLEGIPFLTGRQKTIQEAPSVRVDPAPTVKVLVSQSAGSGPITEWTGDSRMADHLPEHYSARESGSIESGDMLGADKEVNSVGANSTITTGIGKQQFDSVFPKQNNSMEYAKSVNTNHLQRSGFQQGLEGSTNLIDSQFQYMRPKTNPSFQSFSKPRLINSFGTGSLSGQSIGNEITSVLPLTPISPEAQLNVPTTGFAIPKTQDITKVIGMIPNQCDMMTSQDMPSLPLAPGLLNSESGLGTGSLNSTLTAIHSAETIKSGPLPDMTKSKIILSSNLEPDNEQEPESVPQVNGFDTHELTES